MVEGNRNRIKESTMSNKKTIFYVLFVVLPVAMMGYQPVKREACSCPNKVKRFLEAAREVEPICPSCPAGWARYGNACYYIDDTPTPKWADAREKCQNMGADLPIINSSAQNQFILDLAKRQDTVTKEGVWLGMQRRDKNLRLDFYWIDGSSLENQAYLNWNGGEPSMYLGGEHCGNMCVIKREQLGKWNDLDCECGSAARCPVVLCQMPL